MCVNSVVAFADVIDICVVVEIERFQNFILTEIIFPLSMHRYCSRRCHHNDVTCAVAITDAIAVRCA